MSATIGNGAQGTCFSGGAGSGGTANPLIYTFTEAGGINGGKGGRGEIVGTYSGQSVSGAGNPNGDEDNDELSTGTGGTLIVIVEGNINLFDSGETHFRADGASGKFFKQTVNDPSTVPFGGGSGGGIVIVVAQNGTSLATNVSALGGRNGGGKGAQSGGDGAAVAYDMSQFLEPPPPPQEVGDGGGIPVTP
jgi:hypothetical protein